MMNSLVKQVRMKWWRMNWISTSESANNSQLSRKHFQTFKKYWELVELGRIYSKKYWELVELGQFYCTLQQFQLWQLEGLKVLPWGEKREKVSTP